MRRNKDIPKINIYKLQLKPGLWVVYVPVRDGEGYQPATIRLSTWNKLMDMGLYPRLHIDKSGYIQAWSPHHRKWKRLARLIVDCNSDQDVSIKDGNELNLLEDNILVIDRDPVKWDRNEFLTLEGGTYYNEIELRLQDNKTDNEMIKQQIKGMITR